VPKDAAFDVHFSCQNCFTISEDMGEVVRDFCRPGPAEMVVILRGQLGGFSSKAKGWVQIASRTATREARLRAHAGAVEVWGPVPAPQRCRLSVATAEHARREIDVQVRHSFCSRQERPEIRGVGVLHGHRLFEVLRHKLRQL